MNLAVFDYHPRKPLSLGRSPNAEERQRIIQAACSPYCQSTHGERETCPTWRPEATA